MNLFKYLWGEIKIELEALIGAGKLPQGLDLGRFSVEPPRDPAHGDIATNAAMVLARDAKAKPRDLAEQIAAKLRADDLIASVDVAGRNQIEIGRAHV